MSEDATCRALLDAMLASDRTLHQVAAGSEPALARAIANLGANALQTADPLSSWHNQDVGCAVEVLAASRPRLLVNLARGWPHATYAKRNALFRAALGSAARHLDRPSMQQELEQALLLDEAHALFGAPDGPPIAFSELARSELPSVSARVLDRSEHIVGDWTPENLEWAAATHLRAIRHQGPALTHACQRYLLFALGRLDVGDPRFLATLELLLATPVRHAVRILATRQLSAAIRSKQDDRICFLSCLAVLYPNWRSP